MPKNLTDVDVFTDPVLVPVGLDGHTAGSYEVPLQALANRTRHLKNEQVEVTADLRGAANLFDAFTISESASIVDLAFGDDGSKLYVLGGTGANRDIYQYALSTPYDISTASYASKSLDATSEEATPTGFALSPDGTRAYVVGNTNARVYSYTLSTAWDISTASYDSANKDVSSETSTPKNVRFKSDGTRMLVSSGAAAFSYTLSTAWDVTTASYDTLSVTTSSQDATGQGVDISPDGRRLILLGVGNRTLYGYTLSTAWDLSTAVYTGDSVLLDPVVLATGALLGSCALDAAGRYLLVPADDDIFKIHVARKVMA